MKFQQHITVTVNGRTVPATITIDAPGLDSATDYLSPAMLLAAAANGQAITYKSRHHADRDVRIELVPAPALAKVSAVVALSAVSQAKAFLRENAKLAYDDATSGVFWTDLRKAATLSGSRALFPDGSIIWNDSQACSLVAT